MVLFLFLAHLGVGIVFTLAVRLARGGREVLPLQRRPRGDPDRRGAGVPLRPASRGSASRGRRSWRWRSPRRRSSLYWATVGRDAGARFVRPSWRSPSAAGLVALVPQALAVVGRRRGHDAGADRRELPQLGGAARRHLHGDDPRPLVSRDPVAAGRAPAVDRQAAHRVDGRPRRGGRRGRLRRRSPRGSPAPGPSFRHYICRSTASSSGSACCSAWPAGAAVVSDVGDGQDPLDAVGDRHSLRRLLHRGRRRGAGEVPRCSRRACPCVSKVAGRFVADCTAVRNLCNLSLRTASGPEGSSAKQILTCAAGLSGPRWNPQIRAVLQSPMSYQVIARKWRPQRFDDVVGQQAVTRTLRNAIASGRLAQAFVFAGPRGVGKTTTARILARALNCVNGPDGRSVRRLRRVRRDRRRPRHGRPRDRRRDAHRRRQHPRGDHRGPRRSRRSATATRSSSSTRCTSSRAASFNALLKSIEEPPPHVVVHDGDDRAGQDSGDGALAVAGVRVPDDRHDGAIADQLRRIVDAEGIARRRRVAAAHRARCRRQHARRAEQARSGDRVHRADDHRRRRRRDGARPGRPRPAARRSCRPSRTRTRRRRSRWPAAPSRWATTCALVCRELSRVVRDLLVLSVDPVARRRSRDRRRRRARAAEGAGRALLARGSAARVRSADARRRPRSGAPRSRAITSRWRCCGGFTCASWCRSRS